jgi:NADPH:quinone reductase
MRAVTVTEHGGPDVLELAEVAEPVPGPGQALVDVAVAGINFIDIYQRSGSYPMARPYVAGVEGAGTVRALGAGAPAALAGRRVGWVNVAGSYAQSVVVDADRLITLPDQVSTQLAAAVLLQGMTAHYLTHDTYPVRPGDTVLVHAAAGGVGLLLAQLVRLRGGQVIGTVSTQAKAARAREAGASEVIVGTAAPAGTAGDFEATVLSAVADRTGGAGVAAVYDGVGGPTFEVSLAALAPRGVLAVFGQAGGPVPPVQLQRLNEAGSVFLTRPNLAHYISDRRELTARSADVLRWVADGDLRVHLDRCYPLADAAAAHRALEGRATTGKVILAV